MLGTRRAFTSALAATAFVLAAGGVAHQAAAQGKDVVILAAASLKNALDEASAAWTRQTGKTTKISYAASSALAKQIEGGIPADIFISADVPWMDYVAERKLIKPASRSDFLGNQIVLIAGKDSKIDLKINKGFDLRAALGRFSVVKRSWRGRYRRLLSVTPTCLVTQQPDTLAVTNVWRFSGDGPDVEGVTVGAPAPPGAGGELELTLTVRSDA